MNHRQPTSADQFAPVVREYEATDTEHVLHGIAIEHGRLVLASDRYLLRLAPDSGRIIDRLETAPDQGGLASDGQYLWQHSEHGFQQLDARTGFVVRSVAPDVDDVTGVACREADLLILHASGRRLTRIHVEPHALSNEAVVIGESETTAPLRGLTWAGGELWSSVEGGLVCIDPSTARVIARIALPTSLRVCDLAADDEGRFWCVDGDGQTVRAFMRPDWAEGDRTSVRYASRPLSERVVDVSTKEDAIAQGIPAESVVSMLGTTFQRILVPIDFSTGSRRALATALVLQDRLRSEVHLFHLAEQGQNAAFLAGTGASVSRTGIGDEARGRLYRFVNDLFPGRASGVSAHAQVGVDVVAAIAGAARHMNATVVILCGGPRHMLFRTHVEKIAQKLEGCAVIVLAADRSAPAS